MMFNMSIINFFLSKMPIPERCCYNCSCDGFIKGSNLCEDIEISKACCSEHMWRKIGYITQNKRCD